MEESILIPDTIEVPDFNPELSYLGEPKQDNKGNWFFPVINYTEEQLIAITKFNAERERLKKLQSTGLENVANEFQAIADDGEALENQSAFPLWSSFEDGHTFPIDFKVQDFEGLELKLYRVIQSHAKQSNWFPSNVSALFVKVLPEGSPLVWEVGIQVTTGQEYLYQPNGNTYIVVQSHTTQLGFEPPNVPALWALKP